MDFNEASAQAASVPPKKGSFTVVPGDLGGHTTATDDQIKGVGEYVSSFAERHLVLTQAVGEPAVDWITIEQPLYTPFTTDCQHFAVELLVQILTDPGADLLEMHEMFFHYRSKLSSAFRLDKLIESQKAELKRQKDAGIIKPLGQSWETAKPLRRFEYFDPETASAGARLGKPRTKQ